MDNKLVDLHIHTNQSDGDLNPNEVILDCIEKNIKIISITDHDTINAYKKIDSKFLNHEHIKIIPGIELSAYSETGTMHILGYNIDINNKELNNKLKELKNKRLYRIINLLNQLKLDYDIRFNDYDIQELICKQSNLGRVDLAKLLIKYKYVNRVNEAFNKYLNDIYNKTKENNIILSGYECISIIKQAGGIPVLAHPKTLKLSEQELIAKIKELREYGLVGLEAINSIHNDYEIDAYLKMADELNLLVSGGSDYHGEKTKPNIELAHHKNRLHVKSLSIFKHL